MAGRMLRVAEVADRWSCSERTVRRRIEDGTLPSTKIKGLRLISEEALDRLFDGGDPAWLNDAEDPSGTADTSAETAHSAGALTLVSTPKTGEKE